MITAARMAAVDRNAEALGVPRKQLMESSGNAIAREVHSMVDPGDSVVLVCGRGNNGGDAFVAARFCSAFDVSVVLLGRPESITTNIARENWDALQNSEFDTTVVTDSTALVDGPLAGMDGKDDPDVIVDAILGTGITGPLREPAATAVRLINERDATVLSVDVPTGIDADTGVVAGEIPGEGSTGGSPDATNSDAVAVDADRVVTFHDTKPALAGLDAPVTVADIGIPEAAETFTGPGDLLQLDRDPESHKGENGEVLIIGGGPYVGAPTLSAMATLRAGADLARVACPDSIAHDVQGFSENLILRPVPGETIVPQHVPRLLELAGASDTVILGPGLGDADATLEAVREFLRTYDGQCVVDADALGVVPDVETAADLICTPHQGELREMGGETDPDWELRAELVTEYAADLDVTLLVKGAYDVVSNGIDTRVNRTGNPGMTVGGTGDVLAGAVGALAAREATFDAAAIGAYVTGRAGDIVVDEQGYGLVATDVIDALPEAMRDE